MKIEQMEENEREGRRDKAVGCIKWIKQMEETKSGPTNFQIRLISNLA